MKSINFEFLRPHRPEFATLAGFAEAYAQADPVSALVKLRTFAEEVVKELYVKLRLPVPPQATLYDLTREDSFRRSVPSVILNKLDSLRVQGNKAAHGDKCSTAAALWILREAYEVASWLFVGIYGGAKDQIPEYREPAITRADNDEEARRERKQILARLAAQEAQMQQLLSELERIRARQAESVSSAETEAVRDQGALAAQVLRFDEATTRRRLIDEALRAAGWDVAGDGSSTEQVGQEVEVLHQPTPSGVGDADYVLYGENGLPLAVIEAKKTAEDAHRGREQARLYADGLEKMHGRRPVIFYSNGFESFIWNDGANETPRVVQGFYSRDSLEYLIFQRENRQPLSTASPDPDIAGRMYQQEAIRRVTERFEAGYRKALIVLATGTGKTRVAVSLCDLLLEAKWAKRVLFLCDRRELRKQADQVFKEHLPGEPRVIVTAGTARDRDKRIYLATYPAMMKIFETFDVGFFDLLIADESHRSIYNRYRDLFRYFDCLQIGLTATPVKLVHRNTYQLFGCQDQDPTAHFSYEEATQSQPPYLVPFKVYKTTTQFQREGIKYSQMTEEQREQLEETEGDPTAIDFEAAQIDRQIFNKDTNRAILRNLMENGIRDASGSRPGKSIIFARNHRHAILLQELFDEMYPQFGGNFCRVIDNYDPRAEQLIDDFKGIGNNPGLTIAISVDMLDTGIDVPEVVNLVFAKPIKSYVKFWQMIGRGTRLCENLFGPGRDKREFYIFDHWGNFEFFEENYEEAEAPASKALLERLFEARLALAEAAHSAQARETFDATIELIAQDIGSLPMNSISVREKVREVAFASDIETLRAFAPATVALLRTAVAPLMQWRAIEGEERAYEFDLLVTRLQTDLLRGAASGVERNREELIGWVRRLPMNLNQVRARAETIERIKAERFWDSPSFVDLEEMRLKLRGLMQFAERSPLSAPPLVIDVSELPDEIRTEQHILQLEGQEMVAYRARVEEVLEQLMDESPALHKIKAGQPVSPGDLEQLCDLVAGLDPQVDLSRLRERLPDLSENLEIAIRSIIGMDAGAVHARFEEFIHRYPQLNSKQLRFLGMLKNYLIKHGLIEIDRLYEPPFTTIDSVGIDGVFTEDPQINELLEIIAAFNPKAGRETADK